MIRSTITGRQWRRPPRVCPAWCGGAHYCTAQHGHPSGEHRSVPIVVRAPYGALVCTRVQGYDGVPRLEMRLQARLDRDEAVASGQAALVATEVDTAVRSALLTAGWIESEQFPALTA